MALAEADRGAGATSPNPAVGAVLVRDDQLLASGYHRKAGLPHAEVEVFSKLKNPGEARGATLYVTLEPCSTHGRTPPCTEAIIGHGLRRVVVGAGDPNPRHRGRGLEILQKAGIEVVAGVCEEECRALNRGFNSWIQTGRPWVFLKMASSLDGRIERPPGESRWFSGRQSRRLVHDLRSRYDAIMAGGETVRRDNPKLTPRCRRFWGQKREIPWRVVVNRRGRIPPESEVLRKDPERTLVFHGEPLGEVFEELGGRGVTSVMVEGGGRLAGELFDRDLVDEVCFFITPWLTGGGAMTVAGRGVGGNDEARRLFEVRSTRCGPDVMVRALTERGSRRA